MYELNDFHKHVKRNLVKDKLYRQKEQKKESIEEQILILTLYKIDDLLLETI